MIKAVTTRQMKQIDTEAIVKYGMPSIMLMENAGRAVANSVIFGFSNRDRTVAVFCGRGNNGGDGLVCARHLIINKYKVSAYLLGRKTKLKKEASININILIKMRQKITEIKDGIDLDSIKKNFKAHLVIDAIFGTGFKGAPDVLSSLVIDFINSFNAPVISIDIPSGLDATTGRAYGSYIKANKTVTLGLPKKGLYKNEGLKACGRITVADIGLPNVRHVYG